MMTKKMYGFWSGLIESENHGEYCDEMIGASSLVASNVPTADRTHEREPGLSFTAMKLRYSFEMLHAGPHLEDHWSLAGHMRDTSAEHECQLRNDAYMDVSCKWIFQFKLMHKM